MSVTPRVMLRRRARGRSVSVGCGDGGASTGGDMARTRPMESGSRPEGVSSSSSKTANMGRVTSREVSRHCG